MDTRFALPENAVVDESYRIVRVVGSGGFGITYEAEDINLGTTVALKEYYPFDFGDRDGFGQSDYGAQVEVARG